MERATRTPKQLAERWECSERHVRNLINRGELPIFPPRRKADQVGAAALVARSVGVPAVLGRRAVPQFSVTAFH